MDNNNSFPKESNESVIEEVELGRSANDTITIEDDDDSSVQQIADVAIVASIPHSSIPVITLDDLDDSENHAEKIDESASSYDHLFYDPAENLKEMQRIDDKYNECIVFRDRGDTHNLQQAYRELKIMSKFFFTKNTLENERITVRYYKMKSDVAIMRYREYKANLKKKNNLPQLNESDSDSESCFHVKIKMLSDVTTDYIIDKNEDGYTSENERVIARSFASDTDERLEDVKDSLRELKKCVKENRYLNGNGTLNLKISKLKAAVKVFASQKAFTDFHSKQLRGEIKNDRLAVDSSFDVGGSMDVNYSSASVSTNRTVNDSMDCGDKTLQENDP